VVLRKWCCGRRCERYRIVFRRGGNFLRYWRGNMRERRRRKDKRKV